MHLKAYFADFRYLIRSFKANSTTCLARIGRLLTPLFQSDLTVLPWFRDLLMATSSSWPVIKGMNLQTLVGVRKGWLGGELEI
jgi:hypothetical protein